MPGPDGRLSDWDITHIRRFLADARAASKAAGQEVPDAHACPYCRSVTWVMGQHIVLDEIPTQPPAAYLIQTESGTPVVPYVVFFCTRCAYTMRFNAAMMGLQFTMGFSGTSIAPPIGPFTSSTGVTGV